MGEKQRIQSYRDLRVWSAGIELVEHVCRVSGRFPPSERYGLQAQIRRAAVSIPSNIAEGYGRRQLGDYVRFLHIANGSLKELETQLLIAERLAFLRPSEALDLLNRADVLGRMLSLLIRNLQRSHPRPKT